MPTLALEYRDDRFVLIIRPESGRALQLVLDRFSIEHLCAACIQLLVKEADPRLLPQEVRVPLLDYMAGSLVTGIDGDGFALIQTEIGNLRPIRLRFDDDSARQIVESFTETLASPMDVRRANRAN